MIPCMAQDRMRMACLGMCLRTCTSSPRGIPLSLLRTRADPTDGRTDGRPHRLAPEVNNVWPFWSYVGGAAGGALGYIVGNIPGAAAGGALSFSLRGGVRYSRCRPLTLTSCPLPAALAGNRLGAVRDAKGKSVAQVFAGLGASQKAEVSPPSPVVAVLG